MRGLAGMKAELGELAQVWEDRLWGAGGWRAEVETGFGTEAFNQTKGFKNIDIYAWWIRHHCESIPHRFFS